MNDKFLIFVCDGGHCYTYITVITVPVFIELAPMSDLKYLGSARPKNKENPMMNRFRDELRSTNCRLANPTAAIIPVEYNTYILKLEVYNCLDFFPVNFNPRNCCKFHNNTQLAADRREITQKALSDRVLLQMIPLIECGKQTAL